jgi:hypothetical protein
VHLLQGHEHGVGAWFPDLEHTLKDVMLTGASHTIVIP